MNEYVRPSADGVTESDRTMTPFVAMAIDADGASEPITRCSVTALLPFWRTMTAPWSLGA